MNAPTCIDPLFREVIERHFSDLKHNFPGNGRKDLSVPVLAEACHSLSKDTVTRTPQARESNETDSPAERMPDSRGGQDNLPLIIVLLAVLEENAILRQRLENLAKVEAEMFPK